MLKLLKVIFKDENRTVGHSMDLEAHLIDGECAVGDIVLVNAETGRPATVVRVVTEVLETDEFNLSYVVALAIMTDVYLVDLVEVGMKFNVENGQWTGYVCKDDEGKYLEIRDRTYLKKKIKEMRITESDPYVVQVSNFNRDDYEKLTFELEGEPTHVMELVDRSVDIEMLERMRMNSYVQDKLPSKLTTEALIARAEYFKKQCGYRNVTTTTYEESLIHVLLPELLVRMKELNARVEELEGSVGNVIGGAKTV